jgi:hypothetical protein
MHEYMSVPNLSITDLHVSCLALCVGVYTLLLRFSQNPWFGPADINGIGGKMNPRRLNMDTSVN